MLIQRRTARAATDKGSVDGDGGPETLLGVLADALAVAGERAAEVLLGVDFALGHLLVDWDLACQNPDGVIDMCGHGWSASWNACAQGGMA